MKVNSKKVALFVSVCAGVIAVGVGVWFGLRVVFPMPSAQSLRQNEALLREKITEGYYNGTAPVSLRILSVNPLEKSVTVRWITDSFLRDFVSTVNTSCVLGESWVAYSFGPPETKQRVAMDKQPYEYADMVFQEKPVVLEGYCVDRECRTIGKQCVLTVFQ